MEDKGFDIVCLNCGSYSCTINDIFDEINGIGYEIICLNCGQKGHE